MNRFQNLRDDRATAAIEFALLVPVLGLLVAGLLDYGNAVNFATKLDDAARAGAHYAMSYAYDTNGINTAVQNATADGSSITLATGSPSTFCTCGSSSATPLAACDGSVACATGTQHNYVSITVQETRPTSLVLNYMSLGITSATLTSTTAIIEVPSVVPPP